MHEAKTARLREKKQMHSVVREFTTYPSLYDKTRKEKITKDIEV